MDVMPGRGEGSGRRGGGSSWSGKVEGGRGRGGEKFVERVRRRSEVCRAGEVEMVERERG